MSESESKLPAGFDWRAFTPDDSPMGMPEIMADPVAQDLSAAKLAQGDPAFDFDLPVYDFSDGTRVETGRTFHLQSAAANRPVALVFGSYT
jgi:hypothetical protein